MLFSIFNHMTKAYRACGCKNVYQLILVKIMMMRNLQSFRKHTVFVVH